MQIALITREFPPEIYGGAGVHVAHLSQELQKHLALDVYCMGDARPGAQSFKIASGNNFAFEVMRTNIDIGKAVSSGKYDLVHSHTWYANLAGQLSAMVLGVPHIITAHSLEPMRPWKREQLGAGYEISCQIEKQTFESASKIIAVSYGMKNDIEEHYPNVDPLNIQVIHNGIDPSVYKPTHDPEVLLKYGIALNTPIVLFVGRITRQKGLQHLLNAVKNIEAHAQIVIAASSPDDEEIGNSIQSQILHLQETSTHSVIWINQHIPRSDLLVLYSEATVFVCPSIYEPLGIVNLEAMACQTPVVASSVGGIPEVVAHDVTGLLVKYDPHNTEDFESNLANHINTLLSNPALAREMGIRARDHVVDNFDWARIARNTIELYQSVVSP